MFVEERFVEDVLFWGIFVHLVDPDRKISATLTLTVKTLENARALE